jgi:Type ISP C-terminal specificity domain
MSKIFHASLQGLATLKNQELLVSDISQTEWSSINIETSGFYLLIPQDSTFRQEYDSWWKITDVFLVNSTGVKTHRDHFVLDFDKSALCQRINNFRDLSISDAQIADLYELKDTRDWKINHCRHSLSNDSSWQKHFTKCLYRPFDFREYYHHANVVELPRQQIMQHMLLGNNLGLIIPKQTKEKWDALATNQIIGHKSLAAYDTNSLFPLYLYPSTPGEIEMGITRKPNIATEFIAKLEQNFGYTPTPEAIFHYIHAIFHSPTYRSRYAEFLKGDFPRVPLTRNVDLFQRLGELGEQLVNLHLMKSPILNQPSSPFINNGGGSIVDAGHPKYENGKVVINKQKDGFIDVPEAVWNFHVGGYQVCHKWLKDRKGRILSPDDIRHYQKIVVTLGETIKLMTKIDEAIPSWPLA